MTRIEIQQQPDDHAAVRLCLPVALWVIVRLSERIIVQRAILQLDRCDHVSSSICVTVVIFGHSSTVSVHIVWGRGRNNSLGNTVRVDLHGELLNDLFTQPAAFAVEIVAGVLELLESSDLVIGGVLVLRCLLQLELNLYFNWIWSKSSHCSRVLFHHRGATGWGSDRRF